MQRGDPYWSHPTYSPRHNRQKLHDGPSNSRGGKPNGRRQRTGDESSPRGGGYALQATRNFTSASTPFALFDQGPVGELLGPIPSFDVVMTDLEATDGSFEGVVMIDNEGYVVWYFDAGEKVEAFDQFTLERGCVGQRPEAQGRAEIGEHLHARPQGQQPRLGTLVAGDAGPFRSADGAHQHGL